MMKRLAAMQLWPLFWTRAHTPISTARSRSAEGMTMNGSAPPSSSTVFLMALPAIAATERPAPSLPVKVAAATRSSSRIACDAVPADEQGLEDALGKAGPTSRLLDVERGLGHVGGVLQQSDVADHEGRGREPDDLPEREVPGHDGQHRADRLVLDVRALLGGRARDRLVGEHRGGVLCVVAQHAHTLGHLVAGLDDRLSHLEGHHLGDGDLVAFITSAMARTSSAARRSSSGGRTKGAVGKGEPPFDLRLVVGLEGLQSFARRRVHR